MLVKIAIVRSEHVRVAFPYVLGKRCHGGVWAVLAACPEHAEPMTLRIAPQTALDDFRIYFFSTALALPTRKASALLRACL